MKKNIPQFEYDKAAKALSLSVSRAKSVDSDIHGNVVIDYDKKGDVVRLNLYDFDFRAFQKSRKAIGQFARSRKASVLARSQT